MLLLQYVETLQEQLLDLLTTAGGRCAHCPHVCPREGLPLPPATLSFPLSGSRIPQHTLEAYEMHVEGLAKQLKRPDLPAFCSTATVPLAGQQQLLLPNTRGGTGSRPGPAAPTAPHVAPVLRPVPVARTPQLSAVQQAAPPAPREARPDARAPPAREPEPAADSKQSRLQTQQQLHVSCYPRCSLFFFSQPVSYWPMWGEGMRSPRRP
jgi:hypothetical protein